MTHHQLRRGREEGKEAGRPVGAPTCFFPEPRVGYLKEKGETQGDRQQLRLRKDRWKCRFTPAANFAGYLLTSRRISGSDWATSETLTRGTIYLTSPNSRTIS